MLLKELTALSGVSGGEDAVRARLRELAEPLCDEVRVDNLGNLICLQHGEGPLVMLAAHMDEVGLMVVGIDDKGLLHYRTVGGIDARALVSKRVLVGDKKIPGVIGAKAIHLQSRSEFETALTHRDLSIDIGTTDKASAEALVSIGDLVAFDSEYVQFGQGYLKAKALDDRAGCWALLEVLKQRYPCRLAVVFTAQEEVGLRGAKVASHRIQPDIGIAVETTAANDSAGIPRRSRVTELTKGPSVTLLDRASISSAKLNAALIDVAEKNGIRYQIKRAATGGNDAGAMATAGRGAVTAVVSTPCRYIHSPSSVIYEDDLLQTRDLLVAFLKSGRANEFIQEANGHAGI